MKRRESQPKDSNEGVAKKPASTKCRVGDVDELAVAGSGIRDQEQENRTSRVEGKRRVCKEPGCTKRARYGGPKPGCCFPHGGGPRCTVPDCNKKRVLKGLCIAHGGYRECKIDGCCRRSYTKGLSSGKRKRNLCKEPGCTKLGRFDGEKKGCCFRHGGGQTCSEPGCTRARLVKGLCGAHGGYYECKVDGCTKRKHSRGYCYAH
ncbi:hypothetical protein PHYSODRAFT_523571 [Phytophthora sojae]|uniref:WRKY19-like zinc finger domain-containing protein n=1 Tax=Phytophthora sojae (strain P6497) TaxID=1094619 RepID=G5A3A5_PHYSP|nr:hypothetical protein PHYSODRAFT_523571 [Phytophthora sojae]EGZ10145.1 hypothetical protein PHYSODRAFT_523571 [Phytophthora sojae]|eukprot:XP_009535006.1 hypothetical protein PHYSODRAFT_523571 [Phytophthora sojae]